MNAQEHCNKPVTMEAEDTEYSRSRILIDESSYTVQIKDYCRALRCHQNIKSVHLKEIKEIKQAYQLPK